jgi:hypothetical protein
MKLLSFALHFQVSLHDQGPWGRRQNMPRSFDRTTSAPQQFRLAKVLENALANSKKPRPASRSPGQIISNCSKHGTPRPGGVSPVTIASPDFHFC